MENTPTAIAGAFFAEIIQGDFERAAACFDATMLAYLPAEKLRASWQAVEAQLGPFQRQLELRVESIPGYERITIPCTFERGNLDMVLMINPEGQISGIGLNPLVSSPAHEAQDTLPGYIQPETFSEEEVQVGEGAWILPGTLTLPRGEGPFPGLVLVHGSGPQDRDETIGPNKPFRDLAWGLASQGIAVLRYEKRTKAYGQQLQHDKTLTVQEETIDDALAATHLLRTRNQIDPHKIFVLGHSLGGYLIPRIGATDHTLAGLVVLAGSTRPLEDIIIDQISYIFSTQESVSEEQRQQLELFKKQAARVKSADLTLDTPASELPFNVTPAYWLDLRDYAPAEMARQLPQPMLILQGESDYQVTSADFAGWQQALSTRTDVTFRSYPGLSHLFAPVPEGKMATPLTYAIPTHVDATVIAEIAQWIKRH